MEELSIRIFKASDGEGFFYDIYEDDLTSFPEAESLDGGLCTTTMQNALEMAVEQANKIIRERNGK